MSEVEINLAEIERRTRAFSDKRRELGHLLSSLQAEVDEAKRKAMKGIRRAVERAKTAHADLHAAIRARPDLFIRPRSVVVDGIKVGYQKQKGTLSFDDGERVCALIRKYIPDLADSLIAVTERPVKDALATLSAADLRRIGVTLTNDTDAVLIKDTVGDIDKLVAALLDSDAGGDDEG